MTSGNLFPFRQCADILRADQFFCIETLSGYRMVQPEDDGFVVYLPPDANDELLGRALLQALDKSRFIWPPDEPTFFKWERYTQCYQNRQKDIMRRYGYKTKREAYESMNWCRAKRSEGKLSIQPHKRDKPEYWSDLPADQTVIVPATTDVVAAGAALRSALDRCG